MIRFAYTPGVIGIVFFVNLLFAGSPEIETYGYTFDSNGHRIYTVIELDDDKYHEYMGVRFFMNYSIVSKNSCITYVLYDGLLGMRVANDVVLSNQFPSQSESNN